MKLRSLLLFLAALGLAGAADAPVVTEALVRIQCDLASGQVQAFFEKTVTVDGQAYRQPWTSVSWATGSEKTVTVDGKAYTYAEVMAAVVAIANQENQPAPTPEPAHATP